MSKAKKFFKNLKFELLGHRSHQAEAERLAELRAASNRLDDAKRIEIEDRFKRTLDYVMLKTNNSSSFDEVVNNRKFGRELHKLSEIVNIEGKYNDQIRIILSYTKVIEMLVNLMDNALECSQLSITTCGGGCDSHAQQHVNATAENKESLNSNANAGVTHHHHRNHNYEYCKDANHIFYSVVYLISGATHTSVSFRKKFNEMGGTQLLLYYISQDDFLNKCIMAVESDPDVNCHILFLMKNIINTIRNLSHSNELDAFKVRLIMLAFIKALRFQEAHLMLAYLILIKMSNDSEIDTMPNKRVFLHKFVQLTAMCVEAIERGEPTLKRIDIELDYGRVASVCQIANSECNYNLIELLEILNHICVSDRIKHEFFVEYNLLDLVKRIILNGNDGELEYAVKLLLQLSFDRQVKKQLNDDENLISMVRKIFSYQYPNKRLVKYSESFVWILDNNFEPTINSPALLLKTIARKSQVDFKTSSDSTSDCVISSEVAANNMNSQLVPVHSIKNQVFMSFEALSRQLCLRVKNDLKSFDFNVWMNDEKYNNYDFAETIEAIKKSECIILCITNNYKLDPACRLEAEFALKINKPIVPLLMQMQSSYFPDGWLGNLIGSKVFIDLKRPSYKQSMEALIKRLRLLTSLEPDESTTVAASSRVLATSATITTLPSSIDDNDNGSGSYFITAKPPDVMISCHYKNKEFAMRIKLEIEKWGLICWISVEKIRGMNLTSVESAISNIECILICITREYEQSSSCKLEAELANDSNKPVIPLILQENFDPDNCGWLQEILEGKDYVDFIKNPYEASIRDLNRELGYQFPQLLSSSSSSSSSSHSTKLN